MFHSAYTSGLNILSFKPIYKEPSFDNNREVIEYVYSWIPSYAIAYPTEGFYYWSINLEKQNLSVSGNIRLADLDKGKISTAYFTTNQPERTVYTKEFTTEDGLEIKKISHFLYDLTFNEKTVRFKIEDTSYLPPQNITLNEDEEFIGHIYDESGIKLFLIFNHKTYSFYEILDDEQGVSDTFEDLGESHFLATRSGFIFYDDNEYKRKILVGINFYNSEQNNYFDGPGDQVPYQLWIRDDLYLAYPNTMLGAGTNEHGVFLNKTSWVRSAISPYHRYKDPEEVLERSRKCDSSEERSIFWTCLTKEWWNTKSFRDNALIKLKEEGKDWPPLPEKIVYPPPA